MEIYKDLNTKATKDFEQLLNSQLSKINIEELAKDMDKVFSIIDNLDLNTLNDESTKSEVKKITQGPVITMFEIEPNEGVRVNKFTNLSTDISPTHLYN